MHDENIVMILLNTLLPLYEYLIITLETILMKKLTIEHMTTRLMYEMSKRKEKSQGKDATIVLHQSKVGNLPSQQGMHTYFNYANQTKLHNFAKKLKNNEKNAKMQRREMNSHLQHNMEHI